ncbi:MAG: VOC family protein [Solirubrobacteraceae bacterium]
MPDLLKHADAFSGIATDDIAAARVFYADTLGLNVDEENGMLWLCLAGGREALVYPKPDHVPADYTVLNFRVSHIEAAVAELSASGVEFERYDFVDEDAINRCGGPYIAWFKDPAGNILSVLQERS